MSRPAVPPGFGLAVGIMAVSCASVMIRFCALPSLSIATWRLTFATLFFVVLGLLRGVRWRALRGRERIFAVGAGFFLSLHFATWITSLSYTSVASSVVLVATNPLWVAVGGALFMGERAGHNTWIGIALAIGGTAVVGFAAEDAGTSGGLLGDALALTGAMCGAAYILIGRRLRAHIDLIEYVSVVYGAAAVFLCAMALASGAPLRGFSAHEWGLLVGMAAIPQVIGHSILNWALRFLPSTQVALTILGEPIGATLLAWWLLQEPVHPLQGAGCVLILAGVVVASRGPRSSVPSGQSPHDDV